VSLRPPLVPLSEQYFPGRVPGANHLQRNNAMRRFLLRLVDRSRPALAQQPQNATQPDRGRQRLSIPGGLRERPKGRAPILRHEGGSLMVGHEISF
jgi:hypothetical protein